MTSGKSSETCEWSRCRTATTSRAAPGHQADTDGIDVGMRHVIECAVANGWLQSTTAGEDSRDWSPQKPNTGLLRCCEELDLELANRTTMTPVLEAFLPMPYLDRRLTIRS